MPGARRVSARPPSSAFASIGAWQVADAIGRLELCSFSAFHNSAFASARNSSPALRISHESASKSRRIAAISARRCRSNSSSSGPASARIALAISRRACIVCGTALKVRGSGGFIPKSVHWSLPVTAPKTQSR